MRRLVLSGLLALVLCPGFGGLSRAEDEASLEYQIKAAYIAKFLRFVYWPEPEQKGADLIVAFYGPDVFGRATERLQGLEVGGRSVRVRRVAALKNVPDWSAVFLAVKDSKIPAALRKLADRPILTIGESARFLESGGMIRFSIADEAVRFEVNPEAATRSGLRVSSRLLRIGDGRRAASPASYAP